MSRLLKADPAALEYLMKVLDETYPLRNPTAQDFADAESEVRFHRYCGKRELIDDLKVALVKKQQEQ